MGPGPVNAHPRVLRAMAADLLRLRWRLDGTLPPASGGQAPRQTPRNLLEAMLAVRDQPDSQLSDDDVAANVLTLLLAERARWKPLDAVVVALAGTIPIASFVAERRVTARVQAGLTPITGQEANAIRRPAR